MKKTLSAILIGFMMIATSTGLAFAEHEDKFSKGKPFAKLQSQINALQAEIDAIQLIPGPEGPEGPQGSAGADGAPGEKGEQGIQGPPGITLTEIEDIQIALCNIFDQTAITPRPGFCPEPIDCPCWPGVTPQQLSDSLSTNGGVIDPAYQFSAGQVAFIGDNDDGDPMAGAFIIPGYYSCQMVGMEELAPNTSSWDPESQQYVPFLLGLTNDEASRCYNDIQIVGGELNWPAPVSQ